MSSSLSRSLRLLAILAVVSGGSGCATKGFVRDEMSSLEGRLGYVENAADEANAEALRAYNLAQSGDDRARMAEYQAQLAKDMALGNIRREEVRGETIYFDFDRAELTDDSKRKLDSVVAELRANPNYMALVSGYTDAIGSDQYNRSLAQRRASAVHYYLAEQLGADFVRVAHLGFGEILPVATNDTRDGRRLNRRAEVSIVRPAPLKEQERDSKPRSERDKKGNNPT